MNEHDSIRDVTILGSTGSIGTQALDVIASHRDRFRVRALTAGGAHSDLLARQAAQFDVPTVGIADPSARANLTQALAHYGIHPQVVVGSDANEHIASMAVDGLSLDARQRSDPEALQQAVVLNGITGSIGLRATLAALASGATLALANKESLVAGGSLVRDALVRPGQIVPVDSEHSAIAQALRSGVHHRGLTSENQDGRSELARLIITASGGPFRGMSRSELASVTPAQALSHPTWSMGPVVTINSSTLVNKGLEVIEAAWLFDVPAEQIVTVVHPQSMVHSMVEFIDGAVIAQTSPPDMHLPIALGLSWPERLGSVARPHSWDEATSWTFEPVDDQTFPAIRIARDALKASPVHPAVFNAANEVAVEAFLAGEITYLQIVDTIERVLGEVETPGDITLDVIEEYEAWAKRRTRAILKSGL